jgi:FtsZ-binding cell division protein ZapB
LDGRLAINLRQVVFWNLLKGTIEGLSEYFGKEWRVMDSIDFEALLRRQAEVQMEIEQLSVKLESLFQEESDLTAAIERAKQGEIRLEEEDEIAEFNKH